jgi:hypothetical protein
MLRFASVTLEGGSVYAESRGGNRLTAEAVTTPEAVEVYLTWDEHNKTLRVTDRADLAVALESGVHELPAAPRGMYYFAYEPAWRIERAGKHLAVK